MKVEDIVTKQEFSLHISVWDVKIIPAGTFVKPIELRYLPKHVVDDPRWNEYDVEISVFCYTSYGIIPLPRSLLRTV